MSKNRVVDQQGRCGCCWIEVRVTVLLVWRNSAAAAVAERVGADLVVVVAVAVGVKDARFGSYCCCVGDRQMIQRATMPLMMIINRLYRRHNTSNNNNNRALFLEVPIHTKVVPRFNRTRIGTR